MNKLSQIISKLLIFEKEPQKIGLSQLKNNTTIEKAQSFSIKKKDVKLSDLMRRVS